MDRQEVEELDKRHTEDAEGRQVEQLAPVRPQASGWVARTIRKSPISAPVLRTSVTRSDESPDSRITFDTVPLIANSVPAPSAIA